MLAIHCNHCNHSEEETDQFVITSCFHIFCDDCVESSQNLCILCKAECTILPINDELPQEVKDYFDHRSIKRYLDAIDKISRFKDIQNSIIMAKYAEYRETHENCKKSIMELRGQQEELGVAILREERYIDCLKVAYDTNNALLEIGPSIINELQTTSSQIEQPE